MPPVPLFSVCCRLVGLCSALQSSVSCIDSAYTALADALSASEATLSTGSSRHQQQQQHQTPLEQQQKQQGMQSAAASSVAHVLGAELSVLKNTAAALIQQLQQQVGVAAEQLLDFQEQHLLQEQQQQLEFTFRLPTKQARQDSISLGGAVPPAQQQQQQLQEESHMGSVAAIPVEGQAAAAAAGGTVLVSVVVLQELQAAAQQHQRRCSKWKARCKQLAQQLALLTAQWKADHAGAAAAAAAAAGGAEGEQADHQHQQQQQHHHQQGVAGDAGAQVCAPGSGQGSPQHSPRLKKVRLWTAACGWLSGCQPRLMGDTLQGLPPPIAYICCIEGERKKAAV